MVDSCSAWPTPRSRSPATRATRCTVAQACDIVFVAPARRGDLLVAEARERTAFGRNAIYDVTVRRGDEVIAEFRGRSRQLSGTIIPSEEES